MALDCDRNRFSRSAFSEACMWTVKPRSLLACSAMRGIAVTGGPAWLIVTSLMFCAQIVGKPPMTPEPAATPAVAAIPLRNRRREDLPRPVLIFPLPMTVPFVIGSGGVVQLGAARHQRLDVGSEILHAD